MAKGEGSTSKGAGSRSTTSGRATPPSSSRYTPPIPREYKVSPRWVPVVMFVLLIGGMLMIICNYLGLVPGGAANNWYLLGGLAMITAGFITATQYR